MQIEAQEIDHVTVQDSVGEVSTYACRDECDGHAAVGPGEQALAIRPRDSSQRKKGDGAEDVVRVGAAVEVTEGNAGVVDVMDGEEVLDDDPAFAAQREILHNPELRHLVDD